MFSFFRGWGWGNLKTHLVCPSYATPLKKINQFLNYLIICSEFFNLRVHCNRIWAENFRIVVTRSNPWSSLFVYFNVKVNQLNQFSGERESQNSKSEKPGNFIKICAIEWVDTATGREKKKEKERIKKEIKCPH